MTTWERLRAQPVEESSDLELAGVVLAVAVQGERQNSEHDRTVAAALREAARRLGAPLRSSAP